jgi:hypothetical protein
MGEIKLNWIPISALQHVALQWLQSFLSIYVQPETNSDASGVAA